MDAKDALALAKKNGHEMGYLFDGCISFCKKCSGMIFNRKPNSSEIDASCVEKECQ